MPIDLSRGSQKPGTKKSSKKRQRSVSPLTSIADSVSSVETTSEDDDGASSDPDNPFKHKPKPKKKKPAAALAPHPVPKPKLKPKPPKSTATTAPVTSSSTAKSKPVASISVAAVSTSTKSSARRVSGPHSRHAEKYAFVRLNETGVLVEDIASEAGSVMWWPSKTVESPTSTAVRVKLYGKFGLSGRLLEIPTTTTGHSVKVSIYKPKETKERFDEKSFIATRGAPPPKKQKLEDAEDLAGDWTRALHEMNADLAYDNDDDDMDELDFSAVVSGKERAVVPTEGNSNASSSSEEEWEPEPADDMIDLGGELVYMRTSGTKKEYWPAMVEGYEHLPGKKPRYKLFHVDGSRTDVLRSNFFTQDEEGFGTCKLGQVESEVVEVTPDSDGEEEEDDSTRGPSPSPTWPLLPSSDDDELGNSFNHISIASQFAYVKPVLSAILNDAYPPAKPRHGGFLKGGVSRINVGKSAAGRGMMSPGDVRDVQRLCSRWVLRDGRFAKRMEEENGDDEGDKEVAIAAGTSLPEEGDGDFTMRAPLSRPASPSARTESAGHSSPGGVPQTSMMDVLEESDAEGSNALSVSERLLLKSTTENTTGNKTAHPPRQRGCEGYEALSGSEKVDYCANVLLPEAIIQLLVWRAGKRTSLNLLSPEEEQTLHDLGEKLTEERDWVEDIRRLRKRKEAMMVKRSQPTASQSISANTSVMSTTTSTRGERASRRR